VLPFDYTRVLGPIDPTADSGAVTNYKAGAGAFVYALAYGGWTEEQITNGMRTLFESTAAVLSEHIIDRTSEEPDHMRASGIHDASLSINPMNNPCDRSYCGICHPEENR
jgi:hypothetical protein